MKKDAQVVVRMPASLRDTIKKLADADQRSLSAYITIVLEEHVRRRTASKRSVA